MIVSEHWISCWVILCSLLCLIYSMTIPLIHFSSWFFALNANQIGLFRVSLLPLLVSWFWYFQFPFVFMRFLWLILLQFSFNMATFCNKLYLSRCFVFDSYGYLQCMMIDVNLQRAESARNATSSGQKVRKRSRFGSIFAFNSSALNPPVVIYDLTLKVSFDLIESVQWIYSCHCHCQDLEKHRHDNTINKL